MAKFDQLQWIPMIVKAYNEVRQRKSATPTPGSESGSGSGPADSNSAATRPDGQPKARSVPAVTRGGKKLLPPKRAVAARRTTASLSPSDSRRRRNHVLAYRKLLRELRETRRKLNRLESIHQQMTNMQSQIERRLAELLQHVEAPERPETSQEAASPRRAAATPAPRPFV